MDDLSRGFLNMKNLDIPSSLYINGYYKTNVNILNLVQLIVVVGILLCVKTG